MEKSKARGHVSPRQRKPGPVCDAAPTRFGQQAGFSNRDQGLVSRLALNDCHEDAEPARTMTAPKTFTLDALCTLSDTPRCTVRCYIERGLVDRPIGKTLAAHC